MHADRKLGTAQADTVPNMPTADLGVDFTEIKTPDVATIVTVFEPAMGRASPRDHRDGRLTA